MDIHRCRFVPFQPASIHHISAITIPDSNGSPLVAVSRAGGKIELWQKVQSNADHLLSDNWVSQYSIQHSQTIEAICLCTGVTHEDEDDSDFESDSDMQEDSQEYREPQVKTAVRLFVASSEGQLVEYSLETMQTALSSDSVGGGAIWCMQVSPCQRYLAIGCEDGCVRLFDIDGPPGTCEYLRCFDRQKGRIVCLSWDTKPAADGEYVIFTGGADGMIRKWSLSFGRSLQRMCVGTSQNADDDVLVWDIKCMSNGQVVTADSLGCVKFWDMKTCTLLQSFRSHSADVLTLAVDSVNNDAVFAGGIDSKIAMLKNIPVEHEEFKSSKWVLTQNRKFHSHDVRAMVWLQGDAPHISNSLKRAADGAAVSEKSPTKNFSDYLMSGGVDTFLNIITGPVDAFPQSIRQPIRVSAFPQASIAKVCRKHRLVVSFHGDTLNVHRVGSVIAAQSSIESGIVGTDGAKFLAQVKLKGTQSIVWLDVAKDGDWITMIDSAAQLHVYKIKSTSRASSPIALVNFSSFVSGSRAYLRSTFCGVDQLCAATSTDFIVFGLTPKEGYFPVVKTVSIAKIMPVSTLSTVCTMESSQCGKYMVAANAFNQFVVLDMESHDIISVPQIREGQHTAVHIATVNDKPTLFIFMSCGGPRVFSAIRAFNILTQQFDAALENKFRAIMWYSSRKEKVAGAVSKGDVMFVWSQRWVGRFDLKCLLEEEPCVENNNMTRPKSVSFTSRFENVLAYDLIGEGLVEESVIVERPWSEIMSTIQAPLAVKKYGI